MNSHLLGRRVATAAISALLVSGLAACGSNDNGSPLQAGGGSTPATSSDGSASAGPTSASQAAGSSVSKDDIAAILTNGMSAIDTAHESMTMDMSAAGQAVEMQAEADLQMKPAMSMSMTMNISGQSIQAILADGAMYMKMPGMPSGKWVKLDLKQMGSVMGGGAMSDALTNPMGMMDKMSAYITSATYDGQETVDGTSAKHYTMTVDMKSAMAAVAPNLPNGTSLPSAADQDFWVDDQGRIVKTVVEMGALGKMTTTMSDFGKAVHITVPPASDVTAMPGMTGIGG